MILRKQCDYCDQCKNVSNLNIKESMKMSVVTGEVRFSYCNLFTAKAKKPGDEPKFSTTLLIPKSDLATKQRVDAEIAAAINEGTASKWNGVRPPIIPIPVHDGDGVKPSDGMPFPAECKGCWVLTASDKNRPEVVDINLNQILNQSEVYSGMYGRASIRFFPYMNNGKKGIGCGLGNVQKTRDGEPLAGNRTSAADDFGGGAMPAAPTTGFPAPGYGTQPAPTYAAPASVYTAPVPVAPPQPAAQYSTDPAGNTYQLINGQWVLIQPAAPVAPPPPPGMIDPITGRPVLGSVMGL
jgi:hypothetical protein